MRRRGLHHPPPFRLPFFTVLPGVFLFVQLLPGTPLAFLTVRILSLLSFLRFLPFFLLRPYSPPYLRISLFLSLPFILPLCSFHPHTAYLIHEPRDPPRERTLTSTPLNNDTRVFFACVTLSARRRRRRCEISSRTRRGGQRKKEAKAKGGLREVGSHRHPRAARLVPVREGRLRYFFSGVNYKTRE